MSATVVLPPELWVRVLQFLPQWQLLRMATVCKAWSVMVRDPMFWTAFDRTFLSQSLQRANMAQPGPIGLAKYIDLLSHRPRFKRLRRLSLDHNIRLGAEEALSLHAAPEADANGYPRFEYKTDVQETTVASIAQACPYIETIDLTGCRTRPVDVVGFLRLPSLKRLWLDLPSQPCALAQLRHSVERLADVRVRFGSLRLQHGLSQFVRFFAQHYPNITTFCALNANLFSHPRHSHGARDPSFRRSYDDKP